MLPLWHEKHRMQPAEALLHPLQRSPIKTESAFVHKTKPIWL